MTDLTDLTRFTSSSIASRQDRLPGPLRGLHRAVLRRFLATGAPPTARWVRQAAAETGLDASALDDLSAADAVHISNGVVTVAYPFSGIATAHRVALDGLPAVYAMCAIDALGLPAMAGRDGQITSADPADGTPHPGDRPQRHLVVNASHGGRRRRARHRLRHRVRLVRGDVPEHRLVRQPPVRARLPGQPRRPRRPDPGRRHRYRSRPPQLRHPAHRSSLTRKEHLRC
jgi:Alkylmercury lyase